MRNEYFENSRRMSLRSHPAFEFFRTMFAETFICFCDNTLLSQSLLVSRQIWQLLVYKYFNNLFSILLLTEKTSDLYLGDGSRPSSSQSVRSEPFRCGTPTAGGNKSVTRRRYDYGNALRKQLTRPKTSADYFGKKLKTCSLPTLLQCKKEILLKCKRHWM